MAGRPVAARGGSGILYGLIAFVIVAVASLGGFVWQLTSNKALQSDNERKARWLQQYGTPPPYYQDEASARNSSAFAVMSKDIEDLALLITGKRDAVRPAIVEGSNNLLKQIADASPGTIEAGDTLLTALKKLRGAYADLNKKNAQLTTDLEEARLENQSLKEGLKTVRDEFEQQVAELSEETARIEQEKTEQLAAKDEQLAKQQAEAEAIAEELSQARVERQRKDREHDIATTRLKEDLQKLRDQIAALKPGGFDPYDILTKADGRVLRAIPGSDVIYINLGAADRIRSGLTFEVFSPIGGERREGFRGKASVEVTAVLQNAAECRVTRMTPGRPIVKGDILVNIAYERNRLPEFVVRGEFDLDYDGQADWNGVEKVTAVIRAWGGQVVDDIDETTDFLVVGTGPHVPTLSTERPVSDVIRDLADSRLDELNEYRRDVEQARTLYIPVITQSQFLFLTGYSGRGPILAD
ncbi:MAG: hypothetical protein ACE5I3_07165 [Phycisphaerae bacterium]